MSRGVYTLQPGTIAYRVAQYLRDKHPEGAWVASVVIADALSIDRNLRAYLSSPVSRGYLKVRKNQDGLLEWSLGDGKELPKPHDFEPDEPLHPAPPALSAPKAMPSSLNRKFDAAMTLDGSLWFQAGEYTMRLHPHEAQQLRRMLAGEAS